MFCSNWGTQWLKIIAQTILEKYYYNNYAFIAWGLQKPKNFNNFCSAKQTLASILIKRDINYKISFLMSILRN
jgi:hypothetical protein